MTRSFQASSLREATKNPKSSTWDFFRDAQSRNRLDAFSMAQPASFSGISPIDSGCQWQDRNLLGSASGSPDRLSTIRRPGEFGRGAWCCGGWWCHKNG